MTIKHQMKNRKPSLECLEDRNMFAGDVFANPVGTEATVNVCHGNHEFQAPVSLITETDVTVASDGWVAARLSSDARDSFSQPVFAHTSPVYVKVGADSSEKKAAARWFDDSIERSLEWVGTKGKFYSDAQRREVADLFRRGQEVYRAILK